MFKSSDLSPAGPHIIITSAAHQSAAERTTFEMAEVKLSSGEYRIFNNTSSRAKSNVCEAFGVILDGEHNQHPTLFETNMELRVCTFSLLIYMRVRVGLRILCRWVRSGIARRGCGAGAGLENQTHAGLWGALSVLCCLLKRSVGWQSGGEASFYAVRCTRIQVGPPRIQWMNACMIWSRGVPIESSRGLHLCLYNKGYHT